MEYFAITTLHNNYLQKHNFISLEYFAITILHVVCLVSVILECNRMTGWNFAIP